MAEQNAQIMQSNIALMDGSKSFDVVIVCTGTPEQAAYWQARLSGPKSILPNGTLVFAVDEDWPGGAGNALGSLYAFMKAAGLATKDGVDLSKELAADRMSCGMYHTAGKGTRLAPLPGSEANNKPGVKLPALAVPGGPPLTILESVIRQTGIYGPSRKGRLSVFWGDQVFIPSVVVGEQARSGHHADILCKLGDMVGAEEWEARGMSKYGLIAVGKQGEAAQVEKVDHATAKRLLSSLGDIERVGPSLGSFSLSSDLLQLLLSTFSAELEDKKGKLDSDPHLWMPLTLSRASYVEVMAQKGVGAGDAEKHFDRMGVVKMALTTGKSSLGLFGAIDIGSSGYWWDYGQLALYQKNCLRVTEDNQEAEDLRSFLSMKRESEGLVGVDCDARSVALGCDIRSGSVEESALCHVHSLHVEAKGAILVGVTARRVVAGPGSIAYNVTDSSESGIALAPGEVVVGVHDEQGGQRILRSGLDIDGGANWKINFRQGQPSFEDIFESNAQVDVGVVEEARTREAAAAWERIISR